MQQRLEQMQDFWEGGSRSDGQLQALLRRGFPGASNPPKVFNIEAVGNEILFLPLEHKIHMLSTPCNILYMFLRVVQTFDEPVGQVKINMTLQNI